MMRFKERFPKLPDGVSGLDILKLSGPMAFTEELRVSVCARLSVCASARVCAQASVSECAFVDPVRLHP